MVRTTVRTQFLHTSLYCLYYTTTLMFQVFASWGQPGMKKFIWPYGVQDPCFFAGMVLLACSNLDAFNRSTLSVRTLHVRLDTIRLVREKLSQPKDETTTIQCIGAVACLANSAMVRDEFHPFRDISLSLRRKIFPYQHNVRRVQMKLVLQNITYITTHITN
jgi:hypothetical protein